MVSTKVPPPRRSFSSLKKMGGTFTAADLAEFQPEWVDADQHNIPWMDSQ